MSTNLKSGACLLFLLTTWLCLPASLFAQGPLNDMFANRILLEGTNLVATGSNVGGAREPGEPENSGAAGGQSVWWTWTAPYSGTLILETIESPFDSTLGIYSGSSVTNLTEVASDDDGGIDQSSRIVVNVQAGAIYQISVDGYSDNDSGNITLSLNLSVVPIPRRPPSDRTALVGTSLTLAIIAESNLPLRYQWQRSGTNLANSSRVTGAETNRLTLKDLSLADSDGYSVVVSNHYGSTTNAVTLSVVEVAPNDLFANRLVLSGDHISVTGNNLGASDEVGEFAGGYPIASVWWTWTAMSSGPVKLAFTNSFARISVYTGASLNDLRLVETANGALILNANAGTNYQISVWDEVYSAGAFSLNLDLISLPVAKAAPRSVSATIGASTSFSSVVLSGSPVTFQWKRNGTNLVDDDAITGSQSSTLTFNSVSLDQAGTYVLISGNQLGSITNQAALRVFEAVSNDFFANRTVVTGTNFTLAGHNVGTTLETGEVPYTTNYPLSSVWFTWTAPSSGVMNSEFNEDSTTFPVVSVFTGENLTNLTRLETFYPGGFQATAGTTYQIQITTRASSAGRFELNFKRILIPKIVDSPYFSGFIGYPAILSVLAQSSSPLSYEWQHHGTNLVENDRITGVHSSELHIANATEADGGDYSVVVSNEAGTITALGSLSVQPLTRLSNAVPRAVALDETGALFVISIPPGQTRFTISAPGLVQILTAQNPDALNNTLTSYFALSNYLTVANPEPGDWIIEVYPFGGDLDGELVADYSTALPSLDNLQLNGGIVTLQLSGLKGWSTTVLETSENLTNWLPMQTNFISANTLSLTNQGNSVVPQSFFRIAVGDRSLSR
jgi:hypothetical protein